MTELRLFQIDTYKCANDDFREELENKLNEIATQPEWWTTDTQKWDGYYDDYGPPVHTWVLSDRSEEEILQVARTVCPHAEIACIYYPIKSKSNLVGMLCAVRPERYSKITITEEELRSRLCIDDLSYYLSYGPKGWLSWQMEHTRAGKDWNPNFPTEIKFSEDKLRRLFQKAEKLRQVWEWELEIPSQTNLLAMIGVPELVQIAKFECCIEFPEGEENIDGEALLDKLLWQYAQFDWRIRKGDPEVHIIFQDPEMFPLILEVENLRDLKETLAAHDSYAMASVTWRDLRFNFHRDDGGSDWRGTVSLP